MKKAIFAILLFCIILTMSACDTETAPHELDFIHEFNLAEIGDGYDNSEFVELSAEQQAELQDILDITTWQATDEVREMGFTATFILKNTDDDVAFFNIYDEETALVVIKFSGTPNEQLLYTADIGLLDSLTHFKESLIVQ